MKRDNFEDILKDKLDSIEVGPPADMWARLSADLPTVRRDDAFGKPSENAGQAGEGQYTPRIRKPSRNKVRWTYIAASVAACFVLFAVIRSFDEVTQIANNGEGQGNFIAPFIEPPLQVVDITGAGIETPEPPIQQVHRGRLIASAATADVLAGTTEPPVEGFTEADGQDHSPQQGTGDQPERQQGTETDNGTTGPTAPRAEPRVQNRGNSNNNDGGMYTIRQREPQTAGRKSRKNAPVSASLYAMNTGGGSNGGNVTSGVKLRNSNLIVVETTDIDEETPATRAPSYSATSPTSSAKLKHDYPLTFGVGVGIPLVGNLSLETGVNYTYMRSKGETVNSTRTVMEQKLHYIGIPVKLKYDIIASNRFGLYASAGAALEKNVSGRVKSTDYVDNTPTMSVSTKTTVKSLQASVGANIGGELKIDNMFGIYVEPGVGYFFENSNQPESYRTEHPLNFTIRAGFRINL